MIASDNVRDPFYAYGDLDMLEVWREGVRILHLDYPFAIGRRRSRDAPAKAMGIAPPRSSRRRARRPDPDATRATSRSSSRARMPTASCCATAPRSTRRRPTYAELDALEGLSP